MLVTSELQGTVVHLDIAPGQLVRSGAPLAVIESMKMHHDVRVPYPCRVSKVHVALGDTVAIGSALVDVEQVAADDVGAAGASTERAAAGAEGAALREVVERHELTLDAARPAAVAKRHARGHRTARENIADLVDAGTFVEYGPLMIAAQRGRRELDDLIANTPADGLVAGLGAVNGAQFAGRESRAVVLSYDYTVLAGTQGLMNHRKKDRLFAIAEQLRLPIVFFTEGGGGRPGDVELAGASALDTLAFRDFARLSGRVPLVGIATGYCFAGNAAILGCCDVTIATEDANIGMGGPAMIEGGGLGVHEPTAIGPTSVQRANGVVDIVVDGDEEAVAAAKQYLSYFQGRSAHCDAADQSRLRDVIAEDRKRVYDVRQAIELLFDSGSVLELRRDFGRGMITALARIDGRPIGVLANDPAHLAGAITAAGSDKAARFLQLCDAHGLPIVSLCDTPGMMVGPEAEETAMVRHCCRLFVTGANLRVPFVSVVLRKAYGLGAQAMMGGSTKAPLACVSWPTGEFGPMGLEGAVRLGYRRELAAAESDEAREALFTAMVEQAYRDGRATNIATWFEIDDVIDPAETRTWITAILEAAPPAERSGARRPNVDTW
ncbi:MAG TPA: carboxyl transferase domain-containing protein [Jatrophihabitans sp.]|nr:carboxyl transferase domain-containing protein [Jatrophihabitans sp.]